MILDGCGVNDDGEHNAFKQAHMPRLDEYVERYAYTTLQASGAAVGLPEGQMGNSEVGHITLGCGNILHQDLVHINNAIDDRTFFSSQQIVGALESAKSRGRPIHLLGLVSDGGVHSHIRHAQALLEMCKQHGVRPALHMITDGRDTNPISALRYLEEITPYLEAAKGEVHSVLGRYYAMDRDQRWERTEKAWRVLTSDEDMPTASSARMAINASYEEVRSDEFIDPVVIRGTERIAEGDDVIFFNFRNDRTRQLCQALMDADFNHFRRDQGGLVAMRTMTVFHEGFDCPVIFATEHPKVTIGQVVSDLGLKQFHCAETEKYPHVTFFINGGRETPYDGETRSMVPSPKVATYDLKPEMSAREVADEVIQVIEDEDDHLIIVNFANGDMVGHTAVPEAIIAALEAMDAQVGRVLDAAVKYQVNVLLTSDHGNCDEMIDAMTGEPHTQHTTNPVPCVVISNDGPVKLMKGQGLSNVSPTLLELMNIPQPELMKSQSLILRD